MGYIGTTASIPIGQAGLHTDDPQVAIPPNAAIVANNISLYRGRVEKSPGSAKYNSTALTSSVLALFDWWPSPTSQRLIAVTTDGKIWRDSSNAWGTSTPIHTFTSTTLTDATIVAGGAEAAGNNRKLFVFTGTKQVQVVDGDGTATADISGPAADWSSNYPTFGIPFQGRMCAFGNGNSRHSLYISGLLDHEDFDTGGSTAADSQVYQIFSGEGDGLVGACVYKGVLLLFKKPFGVYVFDWTGTDTAPSIQRFSDAFGAASAHSTSIVLDDLLGYANTNSVFSLKATQAFGNLEQGDVLSNSRVRDYVRQNFDPTGIPYAHATYYPEKEIAIYTGRNTAAAASNNRMLMLDVSKPSQTKITVETKDSPTCLALRKDGNGVLRPIYGAADGFVYLMDQNARNVAGAAYTGEYQTPFIDFSYLDASLSDKTKLFDFLQVSFTAVGAWSFYVDTYIDGDFVETITYSMSAPGGLGTFVLDVDRLSTRQASSSRRPLHGTGRAISFRIYNSNVNEYFSVERLVVGFRIGGEGNRTSVSA